MGYLSFVVLVFHDLLEDRAAADEDSGFHVDIVNGADICGTVFIGSFHKEEGDTINDQRDGYYNRHFFGRIAPLCQAGG